MTPTRAAFPLPLHRTPLQETKLKWMHRFVYMLRNKAGFCLQVSCKRQTCVFVAVKQQTGHGLIGTNVEPLPLDPRELITDCWLKYQTSLTRNEHIVLLRLQNPFVSALWSQQSVTWVTKTHQDTIVAEVKTGKMNLFFLGWLPFYISVLYWSVGGSKAIRGINK